MAFILARNRINIDEEDEKLKDIISNKYLSHFFQKICKDFNILDAKKPRDVYKEMIGEKEEKIDSALINLADSFVNGLVNLGTSKDTLFGV